jgi:hypothetical protein
MTDTPQPQAPVQAVLLGSPRPAVWCDRFSVSSSEKAVLITFYSEGAVDSAGTLAPVAAFTAAVAPADAHALLNVLATSLNALQTLRADETKPQ